MLDNDEDDRDETEHRKYRRPHDWNDRQEDAQSVGACQSGDGRAGRGFFGGRQRTAELRFALFRLGLQRIGDFGNDVVLLSSRSMTQASWTMRSSDALIRRISSRSASRIGSPSGESR